MQQPHGPCPPTPRPVPAALYQLIPRGTCHPMTFQGSTGTTVLEATGRRGGVRGTRGPPAHTELLSAPPPVHVPGEASRPPAGKVLPRLSAGKLHS